LAAVLYGPRDLRFEERPTPEPGSGEVLVRVKVCGICRSDYHYWRHGRIGEFVVREPLILGHELSGVVEEVGGDVEGIRRGDRVVVEPGVPCGRCIYCRSGRYNLCPHVKFMATPPVDGAFREYLVWPASFVYPMPASLSFEEGALMEPFSVALWAVHRANVRPGSTAAVFGVGAVGMLILEALKIAGAARIFAVDVDDWKLEIAAKRGADAGFNPLRSDPVEEIRRETGGEGVDYAFEASGAVQASRQALMATRRGGTLTLVGLYSVDELSYPLLSAIVREVDIRGVHRFANMFQKSIALVSSGRASIRDLVTHKFPLRDLERGFRLMEEGGRYIKIQVDVS